ncbi:hypothetical protein CDAR_120631 [Caerostris darwini]|uniref:Uncharacterized protein n=1 Tax=Caerostris darwini TaxID=1538125 RepID=A0AAV4S3H0_9ARAC|nr:hypothetical protein CDAR_120631 [Caerostris darwini]
MAVLEENLGSRGVMDGARKVFAAEVWVQMIEMCTYFSYLLDSDGKHLWLKKYGRLRRKVGAVKVLWMEPV